MSAIAREQAPLWGSRFRKALHPHAKEFSSSIAFDKQLFREDIAGSIAHVEMLAAVGILSESESKIISIALDEIQQEIENGELIFATDEEDIHLAIEKRLTEKAGEVGEKLHTARSRNDQVALDERLYLRRTVPHLLDALRSLQRSLLVKAEEHSGTLMPGYTHLQRAQPVLASHHLLAYIAMLARDAARFQDALERASYSPLGAAAFAGTSFDIDREHTAKKLGLNGVIHNSIDAVSDRDYLIELASACSITMMHLSRLAEELVLWSSREFGFIVMDDSVTTGSSIMPQKKNPDMAELVRGKTGKVYGALVNLLTIMKSLPLAYNRDMQEDKQPMFDCITTTTECLEIMSLVIDRTIFVKERMAAALAGGHLNATDVAEYLARKGSTFRNAHHIVGAIVAYCDERSLMLADLDLMTLHTFSPLFEEDIFAALAPEQSIGLKQSLGSTSHESVREQIAYWKTQL